MFWVNDTLDNRHNKIRAFSSREDIMIGYLLAAADFEWTLRRAILGLGYRATKIIRYVSLKNCHGPDLYEKVWEKEVYPLRHKRLPEVLSGWKNLCTKAFPLRHQLIHGIKGTPGVPFATDRRDIFLAASTELVRYAHAEGVELYKRIPVRLKDR